MHKNTLLFSTGISPDFHTASTNVSITVKNTNGNCEGLYDIDENGFSVLTRKIFRGML